MPQNPLPARLNGPWVTLLTLVLVVGILYTGKEVLLPMALGVVLAFVLTPLVRQFDRMHLPRFAGVALTMVLALSAVGGMGYVVYDQFAQLSGEISQYTSSMRRKLSQLRMGNDAAIQQFTRTLDRVTDQFYDDPDQRKAQPVRVVPTKLPPTQRLRESFSTIFEPVASAFIVIVLVAFLLGQREDLRDRFIRLIGAGNVTMTTRLMNEAAYRVSQFLVWQTLINVGFGILVGLGLYWIGVPYAALWGGMTALLRFVPYVGTVLSALMPASLAFATFPGWSETAETLALFLGLDLITAYFVEPVVFGYRTGVSSFALLISALFWIWVWGPVGLLLATPLTVCIAVLGRHVRSLRFLAVIFADEPALQPHVRFYQRLLARDEDEAGVLINRMLHEVGPLAVIDEVLVPTVTLVLSHREQNEISEDDTDFVLDVVAETLQQLPSIENVLMPKTNIIGLTVRAPADQLVLEMLRTAYGRDRIALMSPELTAEEALRAAIRQAPAMICIAAAASTRGSELRNYCRRIRSELPETRIIVMRPQLPDDEAPRSIERFREAGANCMVVDAKQAVAAIDRLLAANAEPENAEPTGKRQLSAQG
ncbi:AI-2E family transporter [Peristeroidobacter agariperforans]|uniref:AI-2E family transporter n=1 Tax=Peristeroidobacter agariperforans TaxID=268404 RepID=UPI0013009EB5|nr:AI-2E family transporter [Peristeroidobacter agariperforans]